MSSVDISDLNDDSGRQRFAFTLSQVQGQLSGKAVKIALLKMVMLLEASPGKEPTPVGLNLIAEFEPAELPQLQKKFQAIKMDETGYLFEMKSTVFKKHIKDWGRSLEPMKVLKIGDFAALTLDHFNLIGPAQIEPPSRQKLLFPTEVSE